MARIMIVEDDSAIRELVRATLAFADHDVIECENGASALDQARGRAPDVVLLDLGLRSEPQGPELCKKLKTGATRVIVVSGASELEARSTIAAGADHFLAKPFSPLELIGKIEAVLGRDEGADGRRKS